MRTFMCKAMLAAAAMVAVPSAANAAIVISSVTPGTVPFSGPTPTWDFETLAPVSGGLVSNSSPSGIRAQPLGSTGNYWAVGPGNGAGDDGILSLASIGDIYSIGFIWGSVDSYNTIEFLDGVGNVLASFNGTAVFNPANGDQTDPNLNPYVQFAISGSDVTALTSIRLKSTSNAFEIDNVAVNAVPEPGTWALMMMGLGFVGLGMRRRRRTVRPQFA